eukprot:gnl/MRDRNA2_/MRDRNA2_184332_c0_seq1.p1 gnl/MRDRNA2_/MRDRNA2_184332_c0~~gnl/MRDRNA2_/MRDRNA2_184332_c0_seq1.p1  ORF type:complete len:219 (-),score=41.14 gnl/MRDRNA2_/MRDRNA2_184332_c0_seq1:92-658(-)
MPVIGIGASASTLVGNAIGANKPVLAKQYLTASIGINTLMWTALAAIMLFGRKTLAAIYSDDQAVQAVISKLLSIFAVVGFADSTQTVLAGGLRGLGKQEFAGAVYLLAYYGLMLPLGCIFAFPLKFGVKGLWYATGSGTSVAVLAFGIYSARLNWVQVAQKAQEKHVCGPNCYWHWQGTQCHDRHPA